jgi:hypothetical protein
VNVIASFYIIIGIDKKAASRRILLRQPFTYLLKSEL